ncbi:ParB/RepB/Spo0J family partition protein [Haliea alexandrii]|uniref:ParB/RepB/Spo0J family partition protein n=1 Tax=Haliea alexandrii TaxID=2448162 RepID=UPI000F0B3435|nr:ParB/RepB/Spo0J family partition protein [Haliea alexandrii]|tara:strand:- start:8105 stop:9979 length:1875 start_codon:yes stop_codon:yes gene_type:complete
MSIELITLDRLVASRHNVRVAKANRETHDALKASIAAEGVLQNLVVVPEGDHFAVIAGGRRLKALQGLATTGQIPGGHPVPCAVRGAGDAVTALSLAENFQREAMHPADQVQAFAELARQGLSESDIALRFGLSEAHVRKLLKLGRVGKAIMNDYRKGRLTLEDVQAFALVDDPKRQLACYQALGEHCSAYASRRWLIGEAIEVGQGIGAFAGINAYEQAGGAVARDLFQEKVYLSATELVERLGLEKLSRAARQLEKGGEWAWVVHGLERESLTTGLIRLPAVLIDGPPDKTSERERLAQCVAELEALDADAPLPDGFDSEDALFEAIDHANEALWQLEDEIEQTYSGFTEAQRRYAGVVVTLNWRGELEVIEGWARPQDIPKTVKDGQPDSDEPGAGEGSDGTTTTEKPLSQALVSDLAAHRRQITKLTLLQHPKLASDLLHYGLCIQVLTGRSWEGRIYCNASYSEVPCASERGDTEDSPAAERLRLARETLNTAWLAEDDEKARLAAFCALAKRDKDQLVTYCTAMLLEHGPRGANVERDVLVDQLAPGFREHWQPTGEYYFKRMTMDQLRDTFGPVLGDFWAESQQGKRKGEVIESLQQAFAEDYAADDPRATWLPAVF